jgi:hypothetical protein
MTQALDALDVGGRLSREATSPARSAPASTGTISRFGTFAITFGISFALYYTVFERLNWPLFTYHPVSGALEFWKQMEGKGPPMFWYGWLVLAGMAALVTSAIATAVPGSILRRATFFCCVLAALWPTCLAVLRSFSADWQSLDAEFMNSVWAAAVPALLIAAAIGYAVSARFVQRVWAPLLLIVPLGGLAVLGYSLQQYFTH